MTRNMFQWWLVALATFTTSAYAADIEVLLTGPDQFVSRSVVIETADNKRISNILAISGFSDSNRTFTVEPAGGRKMDVMAKDVLALQFTRHGNRPGQQAQQCGPYLLQHKETEWQLDIAGSALRLADGKLTLDETLLLPAKSKAAVLEIDRLIYDKGRDRFVLHLQAWDYKIESGGCGTSDRKPPQKPLQ